MKPDRLEAAAAIAPAVLLAAATGVGIAAVAATLEPPERQLWLAVLESRAALIAMLWLAASIALGTWTRRLWQHRVGAAGRLAEQAQALAATGAAHPLALPGSAEVQALQGAFNALVAQRTALETRIDERVRAAGREVELERSRLAALMAELQHSVVVCNLDGRILLYNSRARLQFRALSDAVAAGSELMGIGRSIYAVFDRELVAHALERVHERLQRGAAHPTAQFVTGTRGGQLLRVQMTPVRGLDGEGPVGGFVLLLDNITRDFADESERDRLLHQLTESTRASLGTLQAAVELLEDPGPDADAAADTAMRERLQQVVRDEVAAMSRRIQEAARHTTETMKTRWPLEDMRGADLLAAAARRIEPLHGCRCDIGEVDAALWLRVDSYSLLQALVHLAGRLVEEHEVRLVHFRLHPQGEDERRAQLDLLWFGAGLSTETVTAWETEPIAVAGQASALSVRDVVERHGGAFWFERERVRHASFFRFLLPLAAEAARLETEAVVQRESRPEFYDFDLFAAREVDAALEQRALSDLTYTVFDTETTGLEPSRGDEILQVGATRIVAGKLRRQEVFEQLVDPGRDVPEAGTAIHGITAAMVAGQPAIGPVLTAFHAFAQDTVLVAHNAAFDLRFLQLKEEATGVRFEQPVLDTLLLSAVIHPQQESHRLEAIAERLGVTVLGRHTALGDAMVTAEVFLKMLPLLAAIGIHTLGQALEACERTAMARLRY